MNVRAFACMAMLAACGGQAPQGAENADLTFHQKPQITITSPAPGSFVAASAEGMVDVAGTTRGAALTVNGAAAQVDAAGNFHARVQAQPGINLIDARASGLLGGDSQRAFIYGDFATLDQQLAGGVMVRANAAAFDDHSGDLDDFSAIARAMLAQVDLMALVKELPPYTYNFSGGSVDVALTDVEFDKNAIALDLSPKAVGAHMSGSLAAVKISLAFTLHYDGDYTTTGTVSVDTVGFDGDLDLSYAGGAIAGSMGLPAIQLGKIGVTTDLDFPGIDDFLTFLANQFKGLIEQTLEQQIAGSAANHVAVTLNQIGLPPSLDLTPYGLPATLLAAGSFDGAWFDGQGSTLSLAMNFASPSAVPQGAPGSLLLGGQAASSFPSSTFAASMSIDALNQATFAVWGQDGLVRQVYPAKSWGIFKLDAVVASPRLPPVITARSDGRLLVALGDIVVQSAVHTLFFDGPMEASISATADIAADIDAASGNLRFTLTGAPQISLDVTNLLGIVPDSLLAPLSAALQQIAPSIVQKMVQPIEVPLPHLPLARLIPGSTATLGLAAPVNVTVDAVAQRVMLDGDLAQY
ncbi:MAG TPA: hypothetical protein VLW85_18330 [Myxococcales bacterium]|nr:hypothetical protein [Myxococcales bacterium]